MAQPLKKKEVKKKNTISDLKQKIIMPKAYQDAIKLPGFPMGYVSTIVGHSNTGKSTLINHAIVAAQRQGIIPVIYDTENNFDFKYAIDMGMDATPVYGDVDVENIDPETGEVTITTENRIIEYEGPFFYFNNSILIDRYGDIDYSTGKRGQKKRAKAVIEDMVYSINEFLEYQANGDIEQGFLFVWDSVGSIGGLKSYNSKVGNNMFDAGTISAAFQDIMDSAIPSSRKVSSPYTNTMIMVNKVWLDGTTNPMAPPSLELKGGKSVTYRSRLIILLGGQLKASVKKLTATSKGVNYNWGVQTKIKVLKNQLPSPYDLTYEGEFICTGFGIIGMDKEEQDEFKKTQVPIIMKRLSDSKADIKSDDITFGESEENEVD